MKRLTLLAIALRALMAADPEPSPEPPPSLSQTIKAGTFDLHWGSLKYRMTLEKDGTYRSGNNDEYAIWVGSWSINEKDNTFTITESIDPDDPRGWTTWEMTIDPGTVKGKVNGRGIPVRVVPSKAAPVPPLLDA